MLATLVLLTTVLFVPIDSLVGDGWVYYYPSAFRPSNGWHIQRGAYYIVGSAPTNASESVGCRYSHTTHTPPVADGVAIIPEPSVPWTGGSGQTQAAIHMVGCTMNNFTFYLWGPTAGSATSEMSLRPSQKNGLLFEVYDANYTLVYNKSMLFASYDAGFLKLKTFQCVSLFGSVYFNGDLLYQLGYDAVLQNVSFIHCNVTKGMFYYMQQYDSLVYFQNGTALDLVLCDDSPRGLLACQYRTGNFTDGLYPYVVDSFVNQTLEVYLTNSVINTTHYGTLVNHTFYNETNAPGISTGSSQLENLKKLVLYQDFRATADYYNFDFSFLQGFEFRTQGSVGSNYGFGSQYSTCGFTLDSINNGNCFNSLRIAITYVPAYGGCYQAMRYFGAQCCYMYVLEESPTGTSDHACYGIDTTNYSYRYKCAIAVLVFMQRGSQICTSNEVPQYVTSSILNNTFVLDTCVNYTIYSRYGVGSITNVTDQVSGTFLDAGGLVVLDSSGAIDVFAVNEVVGRHYFKVNPCSDVNQQYVVSGGNIVGRLTSVNESGSRFLDNQYYIPLINNTRSKRSVQSDIVTSCAYVSYGQYCINPDASVVQIQPDTFDGVVTPLLNATEYVLIPDSFNLTVTDEYIQTRMEQIQINCIQYVCGSSVQCRQLFQQYGSVCDNILSIVNGLAQQDNAELISLYSSTRPGENYPPVFNNFDTGGFNISLMLPQNKSGVQSRSFIEDLLFTKIESVGLPTDAEYQKCTAGLLGWVKDLVCAQYYNGIMVLPPVITNEMQFMYTSSLVASMMFGGLTSAGAIPFATQVQARINHLGITQTLILKNQELLANSFNNALQYMQQGFEATSQALQQIQDVVNQQAAVLTEVMSSLNKNFGAISSVIQDIYKQLDELSANAQVDRLITGRLSSLSVLASSKQAEYLRVAQQRQLAQDKINECVRSQSTRNSFCGNGMHVLSIPQSAPNGIAFIHFTYTPQTYKNVTAVVGFCVTTNGSEYGLVPVNGRGIFIYVDDAYYITSRDMYMPRNITSGDVVVLTSCQANYVTVNRTVITTFVDDDFDFDDEFEKWWNQTDHVIPDLDEFNYTIPILDINNEIDRIQQAIQGLNQSYVDLESLSILTTYIKWPWYVWLAIAFATIIFILILCWIFFMTGCCGCCCGCFGLIPLMSKCRKKSSYYTTFDDDIVGEQIRPKKSV
uniref:Spike protein n=1 Tax=Bird gammacoronavirus AnasCN24 TaxID=3237959 RepID=A0AB39AEG4_9GAMC